LELLGRNDHGAGADNLIASTDAEGVSTPLRPRFGRYRETIVRGYLLLEANSAHLDDSHRAIKSVTDELVHHAELGYSRQDRPAGEMTVKPLRTRRQMHFSRKLSIFAAVRGAYVHIMPHPGFSCKFDELIRNKGPPIFLIYAIFIVKDYFFAIESPLALAASAGV
jgi:hypothetical protein